MLSQLNFFIWHFWVSIYYPKWNFLTFSLIAILKIILMLLWKKRWCSKILLRFKKKKEDLAKSTQVVIEE